MQSQCKKIEIGIKIQTRREQLGITQRILAERLDVSEGTIANWERGYSCPDVAMAIRLCQELNIELDYLIGKQSQPPSRLSPEQAYRLSRDTMFIIIVLCIALIIGVGVIMSCVIMNRMWSWILSLMMAGALVIIIIYIIRFGKEYHYYCRIAYPPEDYAEYDYFRTKKHDKR